MRRRRDTRQGRHAGASAGVGVSSSVSPYPTGFSVQNGAYSEINWGEGPSTGLSGSVAGDGSFSIFKPLNLGGGFGAMAGIGVIRTVTIATPPLWPW